MFLLIDVICFHIHSLLKISIIIICTRSGSTSSSIGGPTSSGGLGVKLCLVLDWLLLLLLLLLIMTIVLLLLLLLVSLYVRLIGRRLLRVAAPSIISITTIAILIHIMMWGWCEVSINIDVDINIVSERLMLGERDRVWWHLHVIHCTTTVTVVVLLLMLLLLLLLVMMLLVGTRMVILLLLLLLWGWALLVLVVLVITHILLLGLLLLLWDRWWSILWIRCILAFTLVQISDRLISLLGHLRVLLFRFLVCQIFDLAVATPTKVHLAPLFAHPVSFGTVWVLTLVLVVWFGAQFRVLFDQSVEYFNSEVIWVFQSFNIRF